MAATKPTVKAIGGAESIKQLHYLTSALKAPRITEAAKRLAHSDTLGSWRTLLALGRERAAQTMDPRVAGLVEGEAAENLLVLQRCLERNGEVDRIAASLHMHRSTVYSRVKRVETKYGLDLGSMEDHDGRDRAAVGATVRLSTRL